MLKSPIPAEARLGADIFTYVGIIEQLARTRAVRGLKGSGLTFPQFVLLNHFRRRPTEETKTVTSIARAMQQPLPGITKTIQKMISSGLIKTSDAPGDGRSKLLILSPKGVKAHDKALESLSVTFRAAFTGWTEAEMIDLFKLLGKLKNWMDTEGRKVSVRANHS